MSKVKRTIREHAIALNTDTNVSYDLNSLHQGTNVCNIHNIEIGPSPKLVINTALSSVEWQHSGTVFCSKKKGENNSECDEVKVRLTAN